MSSELVKRAKQRIVGHYRDWIKEFDVSEYRDNPPLIEKLHEEKQLALATSLELEERVADLTNQVHELELENQSLADQLEAREQRSFVAFILSLITAVSVSIGTNIATDKPYGWVGWILIGFSAILEFVIFLNLRKKQG
jgi:hypothetical protein